MPDHTLSGRRILVVEDEYFLADELHTGLKEAGVVVLGPVPSVEGALDMLAAEDAPDAAVLDINLGGEMAHAVADALADRHVPFLFTTGYERAPTPERHATVPRLGKPVEMRAVRRELERLLCPPALPSS